MIYLASATLFFATLQVRILMPMMVTLTTRHKSRTTPQDALTAMNGELLRTSAGPACEDLCSPLSIVKEGLRSEAEMKMLV